MGLPPFLSYGLGGGAQVCSGGKVFMKVCEKNMVENNPPQCSVRTCILLNYSTQIKPYFFGGGDGWVSLKMVK